MEAFDIFKKDMDKIRVDINDQFEEAKQYRLKVEKEADEWAENYRQITTETQEALLQSIQSRDEISKEYLEYAQKSRDEVKAWRDERHKEWEAQQPVKPTNKILLFLWMADEKITKTHTYIISPITFLLLALACIFAGYMMGHATK